VVPYPSAGTYSWSATGLPAGLSINGSGVISGTPTVSGNFSPNITITDTSTSKSITVGHSLTVNAYDITTGGVLPAGIVNNPYINQTLRAPGCGTGCTWSVAGGTLPFGLALSTGGVISGTPNSVLSPNGTSGLFTALIQVTGSNGTVSKQFSFEIANNSVTPRQTWTTAPSPATGVGPLGSFGVAPFGGPPPYSVALQSGTLPPGLTLQSPGETISAGFAPGITYVAGRGMQVGV